LRKDFLVRNSIFALEIARCMLSRLLRRPNISFGIFKVLIIDLWNSSRNSVPHQLCRCPQTTEKSVPL
jgi:hypothetical protein